MKHLRLLFCLTMAVLSINCLRAQQFTSSNLPIITINTNSQPIYDSPKVMADMNVYYHANGSRNYLTDPPAYTGKIGIEIRGASSASFQKVCYGFETWDAAGLAIDTPLINMPSESDWILYASHNDKSFLRNVLTYDLYNRMGRYASRTQHCEVVINGLYMGIYVLMEKVKRDKNRVDIAKLKTIDTAGVEVTGGYILKIDYYNNGDNGPGGFATNVQNGVGGGWIDFGYDHPSPYDIVPQQAQYIKSYVDSFQLALFGNNFTDTTNGFRKFANEASFIDYLLLEEFARNPDIYVRSTYIVKPKDDEGKKIEMGPPWDCDICYGNIQWIFAESPVGFYYSDMQLARLGWEQRMMADPLYANRVKCRWLYLRQNELSVPRIHQYIDSMAAYLNESQQRNFLRWPVLNQNVFINVPPYPQSYQEEIDTLKSFIAQRVAWMDYFLPGTCTSIGIDEEKQLSASVQAFPNPSHEDFYCSISTSRSEEVVITVTDLTGRMVESFSPVSLNPGENTIHIQPKQQWPSGVYMLTISGSSGKRSVRLVR